MTLLPPTNIIFSLYQIITWIAIGYLYYQTRKLQESHILQNAKQKAFQTTLERFGRQEERNWKNQITANRTMAKELTHHEGQLRTMHGTITRLARQSSAT